MDRFLGSWLEPSLSELGWDGARRQGGGPNWGALGSWLGLEDLQEFLEEFVRWSGHLPRVVERQAKSYCSKGSQTLGVTIVILRFPEHLLTDRAKLSVKPFLHLILIINPWCGHYYYHSHFTHEDTEASRW